MLLEGQTGIITGAGSGIGRATAALLSREGASLVLAGRNPASLEETAKGLPGEKVRIVRTDVQSEEDVRSLVSQTVETFGGLNFAYNNAAIFGDFKPLHEDSLANFEEVIATNLRGIWLCMKFQLSYMAEKKAGSIVNCASVAGHIGHQGSAVYSASKHGIIGLSKSAALQYAPMNIRVNVVSPGSTETAMLCSLYKSEEDLQRRAARLPLGRMVRPDDVAEAVLWLCSGNSRSSTGSVVHVDGGVLAGR